MEKNSRATLNEKQKLEIKHYFQRSKKIMMLYKKILKNKEKKVTQQLRKWKKDYEN